MTDVDKSILKIIARKANVDVSTLSRDTKFSDLEIDSLDVVEIIFDIEEEFDISVPYNANEAKSADGLDLNTIGQVIDMVSQLVNPDDRLKSK